MLMKAVRHTLQYIVPEPGVTSLVVKCDPAVPPVCDINGVDRCATSLAQQWFPAVHQVEPVAIDVARAVILIPRLLSMSLSFYPNGFIH